jgi:hypothetical protein
MPQCFSSGRLYSRSSGEILNGINRHEVELGEKAGGWPLAKTLKAEASAMPEYMVYTIQPPNQSIPQRSCFGKFF